MFVGSGGWVPKPNHLLGNDETTVSVSRCNLTCEVVSGCNSACLVYNPTVSSLGFIYKRIYSTCERHQHQSIHPRRAIPRIRGPKCRVPGDEFLLSKCVQRWLHLEKGDQLGVYRWWHGLRTVCNGFRMIAFNRAQRRLDFIIFSISVYCSEFGKDDRLGTFCARVKYLRPGWKLIRLFDKTGKHNGGLLLVRFNKKRV